MIPAQDHGGEPRCPDCGSVDPCEHDDPSRVLVNALFGLATFGALALVVQGFLRHSYSELLRGSATSRAIRVAYAGTGGKASMVRAFDEIERSLRVRGAA